jgi:outer membrane biosynthesis protein TonB
MRTRFVQAGSSLLILGLTGCPFSPFSKPKSEPPIALAKLPTMAYPVVLPPPEPVPAPPEPVAIDVPPSMPAPKMTKPRPKPRQPKVVTEKPSASADASQQQLPPTANQKVTISPGGGSPATSPGISASLGHTDEAHQRETTAQLLQSTEDNLRNLNRQLSADERAVVDQIRNFVTQSRAAITDGDAVRAHNLALKAHLLSDELARP